ncbi:hypothetical protein K523DRAFT_325837 [Schizophyllum commune Tattone D]|nr:hypothetical protein K523DRAFT_325837 [Schizophyllum commune Tattone D]
MAVCIAARPRRSYKSTVVIHGSVSVTCNELEALGAWDARLGALGVAPVIPFRARVAVCARQTAWTSLKGLEILRSNS